MCGCVLWTGIYGSSGYSTSQVGRIESPWVHPCNYRPPPRQRKGWGMSQTKVFALEAKLSRFTNNLALAIYVHVRPSLAQMSVSWTFPVVMRTDSVGPASLKLQGKLLRQNQDAYSVSKGWGLTPEQKRLIRRERWVSFSRTSVVGFTSPSKKWVAQAKPQVETYMKGAGQVFYTGLWSSQILVRCDKECCLKDWTFGQPLHSLVPYDM